MMNGRDKFNGCALTGAQIRQIKRYFNPTNIDGLNEIVIDDIAIVIADGEIADMFYTCSGETISMTVQQRKNLNQFINNKIKEVWK